MLLQGSAVTTCERVLLCRRRRGRVAHRDGPVEGLNTNNVVLNPTQINALHNPINTVKTQE